MAQGKEEEAKELLQVLEWVAAGNAPVQQQVAVVAPAVPAAAPAAPAAAPASSKKTFTPEQALQIEEATALAHQVMRLQCVS